MDEAITRWINAPAGRSDLIDAAMLATASFGVTLMIMFLISLWWVGSPIKKVRHACVAAIIAIFGSILMVEGLRPLIPHAPPFATGVTHLIVPPYSDIFFHGYHAGIAASIFFTLLLNRVVPVWTTMLGIMAALVCYARVYVGLRYAGDVLNGVGLAAAASIMVHVLYRRDLRVAIWITRWL